jgi:hypothetical protein
MNSSRDHSVANKRQFSLAYLFLETFWIAVTLALARQAYWLHYRYRSDYDSWYSPDKEVQFDLLVVAAVICAGAATGGVFHRMLVGASVTILILLGMVFVAFLFTPAVQ